MNKPTAANLKELRLLQDLVADAVDSMSDEEIAAELCEHGMEIEESGIRFSALLAKVKIHAGKTQLRAARAAIQQDRSLSQQHNVLDITSARRRVKAVIANEPPGSQFMLAARNATAKDIDALPDNDVLAMLEMARLLGKDSGEQKS